MTSNTMTLEEISEALHDFYRVIEVNRDRHCGDNQGEEPTHFRNPMIQFLIDNLEDESVAVDLLCGDLVVSLAILYLQREKKISQKIRRVYAVDNDDAGKFDLIKTNSGYFGLGTQVIPVLWDVSDRGLAKKIGETPDVSLVIKGSGYVCTPSCVRKPANFFKNLAKLGPLSFAIELPPIPASYKKAYESFFDLEEGTIAENIRGYNNIIYYKGTPKGQGRSKIRV